MLTLITFKLVITFTVIWPHPHGYISLHQQKYFHHVEIVPEHFIFYSLVLVACANTRSTKRFVAKAHVLADELWTRDYLSIITPSPTQLLSLWPADCSFDARGCFSAGICSAPWGLLESRSCRPDQILHPLALPLIANKSTPALGRTQSTWNHWLAFFCSSLEQLKTGVDSKRSLKSIACVLKKCGGYVDISSH